MDNLPRQGRGRRLLQTGRRITQTGCEIKDIVSEIFWVSEGEVSVYQRACRRQAKAVRAMAIASSSSSDFFELSISTSSFTILFICILSALP